MRKNHVMTAALAASATLCLPTSTNAQIAASGNAAAPAGRAWANTSLGPDERARLVVAAMTQDEKFAWLSGPMAIPSEGGRKPDGAIGSAGFFPAIPRLGIPAIQQADASLGIGNLQDVRPGDNATALPASLLLGATFDPELAFASGAMIGREARAKGFNVLLAGGGNLVREPRGGRNFEYISEDPLLTGVMMGHSVRGVQSNRIVSTVKHFVLNPQETGRVMVSSDLSEPAMHESDLLAFRIGIDIGKPGAVMPGYNLINSHYASENAYLINTVLKGDWNYPGWVMADWGATHSTVKAALAGLDVQSGANLDDKPYFGAPLRQAVAQGRVPQSRIDDMVRRQLRSLFAVGAIDDPAVPGVPIDYEEHRLIAQRVAEKGIVLLKNDAKLLPFAQGAKRILVIGRRADAGVLSGGGSSSVTPVGSVKEPGVDMTGLEAPRVYHPSSPLHAIRAEARAAEVAFLDGRDVQAARAQAAKADLVVVVAEEWRAESLDAKGLSLPDGQDALIAAVAGANPRTVVVVQSAGPVTMPWLPKVGAVLQAFYPGSGGGPAIAGILFGRVNPSGRLPFTFPASEKQLPRIAQRDPETTTSNPGMPRKGGIFHVSYDVEGADVGYRWYDRQKLKPLFPFGYGLSYASFAYSDVTVRSSGQEAEVSVTVTNTGDRVGATVPQVYVSKAGRDGFVPRLAAFRKVELAPGARETLVLKLDMRVLGRVTPGERSYRVGGTYQVRLADHAGDDRIAPIPVTVSDRVL